MDCALGGLFDVSARQSQDKHELLTEARASGLSAEALFWLEYGERGVSADTMFSVITGFHLRWKCDYSTPRDTDDFRRCRLLLECVPELEDNLQMMTGIDEWSDLVSRWGEICRMMDEETPRWREARGRASRTTQLIQGILMAE